jgi:hypothetical protein
MELTERGQARECRLRSDVGRYGPCSLLPVLAVFEAQGYLLKEVPPEPRGWDGELWSTDLTLEGYRFAQYSHYRWIGRILKFRDAPSDLVYLTKWHAKFAALPKETFAAYDA